MILPLICSHSTHSVLFMVPGLAFLYAGLARRKNALSLIWAVIFANAVTIFTWYLWAYSLAFSPTATNGFIGNLHNIVLLNVTGLQAPSSILIPDLLFAFFQLQFCAVTVGILVGAIAERGRVMPAMIFTFFWVTLVYSPVAYWAWGLNGWGFKWGVLDYAGGGPVEIGSGVGGLAYSWVLGRRRPRELVNFRPHNVTLIALGTFMLWFGWLGFNAGSAFGANMRAITAAWNTCLAAAFSGITWCLVRSFRSHIQSNPQVLTHPPARFPFAKEVHRRRSLFRYYCWSRCCDPFVWIYSFLGVNRPRCCLWCSVQLQHKNQALGAHRRRARSLC